MFKNILKLVNSYIKFRLSRSLRTIHSDNVEHYQNVAIFAYDRIGLEIQMHGIYEKNILYGLSKILFNQIDSRNSICLDIGANIGNHSLIFSKYFQSVYSFEPNSDIFDLLHINTKRLNNIKIFNFGASDKDESVTMQTNQKSSMGGMSVKEKESDIIPDIEVFNASMKNMDNFFRDYPVDADISFIKIDVEGFELNTLKGLRNTLNKYHPVIGFEQHQDDFFNNENIISSQSIDQIRQCGYSFFYEIRIYPGWISGLKIQQKYIKKISHIIELILFAAPKIKVQLASIHKFERKKYPMIIASSELLEELTVDMGQLYNR